MRTRLRVQTNNFDYADQLKVLKSTYHINFNVFAHFIKELETYLYYPIKLMQTRMRIYIDNFDHVDQLTVLISTFDININPLAFVIKGLQTF